MKTVGELLHSLNKIAVLSLLPTLYQGDGEDPEGYARVWDQLLALQPKATDMTVVLSRHPDMHKPELTHIHVSGLHAGDPQHWAIEFTDWAEWLAMPVTLDDALSTMSEPEALAHCLYEMTWAGYDYAQMQTNRCDFFETLEERMEDVRQQFPESFDEEMENRKLQ